MADDHTFEQDVWELMLERHSVRQYEEREIPEETREKLDAFIAACNQEGKLHIQAIYEEPDCFSSRMARYGKFEGCRNYIALIGEKRAGLDECCGYYGEKIVLKAQDLGLNTCWVAMTHGKSQAEVRRGEREVILISLGYGKTPGTTRKSKTAAQVSNCRPDSPQWFKRGVEAALLAPTAMNQQKFRLLLDGDRVRAEASGFGPYTKLDLGIVKYQFELGAGQENFSWA
ncbi:MAG: nitroreductase [Firmicutes bacterium]|nr:nitroreductase [Bacillota bacterium]